MMFASIIKKCLIISIFFSLWGCAPSRDFQATPQEGAQRSSTFPRFSDRPQSASQSLTREMEAEVQKLRKQGRTSSQQMNNPKLETQNLREEVAQTLRDIEQADPQSQSQSQSQP